VKRLDLSNYVPPNAKYAKRSFEIAPVSASIVVYRYEQDLFPVVVHGSAGEVEVQLVTPQTIFIEALPNVQYQLSVLGYQC
jgi:hypothetical protein